MFPPFLFLERLPPKKPSFSPGFVALVGPRLLPLFCQYAMKVLLVYGDIIGTENLQGHIQIRNLIANQEKWSSFVQPTLFLKCYQLLDFHVERVGNVAKIRLVYMIVYFCFEHVIIGRNAVCATLSCPPRG